jgi:NAD(P)-dependent dehydrogenase (short-subunit alcohol dehydrogenase family)
LRDWEKRIKTLTYEKNNSYSQGSLQDLASRLQSFLQLKGIQFMELSEEMWKSELFNNRIKTRPHQYSDSIRQAVANHSAKRRRIDVLINNAGMHTGGPIETSPTENIKLQMDTNFLGMVNLTREVLPANEKTGWWYNN